MTAADWGLWIAVATLVAGTGKFLDDYHIKSATKSKVRDVLTRWFLWLDQSSVPDVGGAVLQLIRKVRASKVLMTLVFIAAAYLAVVSTLWWWRMYIGRPSEESYVSYVINWLELDSGSSFWLRYMLAILIPALVGSWAMAVILHLASATESELKRVGLLVAGVVAGISISLLGGFLAGMLVDGGHYGLAASVARPQASLSGAFVAALAAPLLPLLFTALVILLIAMRATLALLRLTMMRVFDVASGPAVSPFTYATTLLGVGILAAKIIQSAVA